MEPFKTNYPITMLYLLGKDWSAKYYIDRVIDGRWVSTAQIRESALREVKWTFFNDY